MGYRYNLNSEIILDSPSKFMEGRLFISDSKIGWYNNTHDCRETVLISSKNTFRSKTMFINIIGGIIRINYETENYYQIFLIENETIKLVQTNKLN